MTILKWHILMMIASRKEEIGENRIVERTLPA